MDDGAGVGVVVIQAVGEDAVHQYRIAHRQLDVHADDAVVAAFGEVADAGQRVLGEIKPGGSEGGAGDIQCVQFGAFANVCGNRVRRQVGGELGNLLRDRQGCGGGCWRGGGCGLCRHGDIRMDGE